MVFNLEQILEFQFNTVLKSKFKSVICQLIVLALFVASNSFSRVHAHESFPFLHARKFLIKFDLVNNSI